jgi:hypothetical protein
VLLLRKTQKPLLKQPKSQLQPLSKNELDDSDDIVVDDEITYGRNRKVDQFGKLVHEEFSDHVRFRLWLARQLAMMKYKEVWT